jgi:RNA polymerase sigma-70 factor (ECF subfamily)
LKVTKSNKELLLLLRKGDRVAFYHIYDRYCKRLYGFVLRYIKQEDDAEEIVQEVFVKLWEARDKIDVYSSFDSFLFTIAYNTTMSLFRKRIKEKKYLEYLKSIQQVQSAPNVIEEIHFNELNANIQTLLDQLTPRQKEIFQMSREEGLAHDEIAKKLDISVNTVKKHMTNTLTFLKSHMDNSLLVNLLFVCLFL